IARSTLSRMVSSPSGLLTFFVSASARKRIVASSLMLSRLILALVLLIHHAPAAWSAGETILVVGDSLSSGYGLPDGRHTWGALLERRLAELGYGREVINASISGDTTAGGLSRLPGLLETHNPELVILELGGNDGLRGLPVATMRSNLEQMIRLAKDSGAD